MHEMCKDCGAACCRGYFTASKEKYIYLRDSNNKVPEHLTEPGPHINRRMKIDETGACVALDKITNTCTIHDCRPQVCREVQPDSPQCLTSKRNMKEHGTRD